MVFLVLSSLMRVPLDVFSYHACALLPVLQLVDLSMMIFCRFFGRVHGSTSTCCRRRRVAIQMCSHVSRPHLHGCCVLSILISHPWYDVFGRDHEGNPVFSLSVLSMLIFHPSYDVYGRDHEGNIALALYLL